LPETAAGANGRTEHGGLAMSEPDSDEAYIDPVIEFYKRDIDRNALRENLKLTVSQRVEQFMKRMSNLEISRNATSDSREATEMGDG
jgi:hypothetical protein